MVFNRTYGFVSAIRTLNSGPIFDAFLRDFCFCGPFFFLYHLFHPIFFAVRWNTQNNTDLFVEILVIIINMTLKQMNEGQMECLTVTVGFIMGFE